MRDPRDPREPREPTAPSDAPIQWAPSAPSMAAVDETIVSEGAIDPPSSIKYEEHVEGATFRALLHVGASQARRDLMGTLAALAAAASVSFVLGGMVLPIAATVVAWPRIVRAMAVERLQIELGPQRFVVQAKARAPITHATAEIHGFGYRRSPLTDAAYDLVVLLRSGWGAAIVVPCDTKEQARFLARRLNAALGEAQRAARTITAGA